MKVLNIIKYIFTIIGAAMLIGTFFMYKNTSEFLENSIETQGVVVELLKTRSTSSSNNNTTHNDIMYKPLVQFTDSKGVQIEFSSSTSSNPPSYSVDEQVTVLYNPKSPNKAKIKSFFSIWGGITILGILGSVFFLTGGGIILYYIRKKNILEHLKLNGKRIETDFQNVTLNTSFAVNGVNPFVIVSQWKNPRTSKIHIFTSDNIWFDPTEFIKTDKITVLIDNENPKKYTVDLSFLPKLAK